MTAEMRYQITVKIVICNMSAFEKDDMSVPSDRGIEVNDVVYTVDQYFTWTPATCASYFPMSYSFEFAKDGLGVSQPSFLIQIPDGPDNRFGYHSLDISEAGVYAI